MNNIGFITLDELPIFTFNKVSRRPIRVLNSSLQYICIGEYNGPRVNPCAPFNRG
jgi:hypothetical protein